MRETFYFTNMCPQVHSLNSGGWNDLEIACRNWARKYGDVYIVCGPVPQQTPIRTIGRNKVWVPREFFKVVLCLRGEGSPKAIGFIYPNASASRKMFSYAMSVDEVERRTSIDFFPQLDDRTEDRVEAERGYF
jgi:endonuclease G